MNGCVIKARPHRVAACWCLGWAPGARSEPPQGLPSARHRSLRVARADPSPCPRPRFPDQPTVHIFCAVAPLSLAGPVGLYVPLWRRGTRWEHTEHRSALVAVPGTSPVSRRLALPAAGDELGRTVMDRRFGDLARQDDRPRGLQVTVGGPGLGRTWGCRPDLLTSLPDLLLLPKCQVPRPSCVFRTRLVGYGLIPCRAQVNGSQFRVLGV